MFVRARAKKDGMKYICKVVKQHNSRVCVIPYGVRAKLGIETGDLVSFTIFDSSTECKFALEIKGVRGRERNKRHSNITDRGRSI